jgi:hypothetical protein
MAGNEQSTDGDANASGQQHDSVHIELVSTGQDSSFGDRETEALVLREAFQAQ